MNDTTALGIAYITLSVGDDTVVGAETETEAAIRYGALQLPFTTFAAADWMLQ